jgi:hypothetical protein
MYLHYETGTLRVENAEGLRWQVVNAAKPPFSFEYDALSVTDDRALRRVGASLQPLALDQLHEARAFISGLVPPDWATLQQQVTTDLRALARGLINSVVGQLEYEGLLDVMITGREGSSDLYAEEARRVLAYVDSVWNAFHALAAQIQNTPTDELKTVKQYGEMMPFPPPPDHFSCGGIFQELMHGAASSG